MKNLKTHKSTIGTLLLMSLLLIAQSCSNMINEVNPVKLKKTVVKEKPSKTDWGLMEWDGDVPDPCKEVCLVAGQHMYVGNVTTALQDGDLFVTYSITESDIYLTEVHLDIFSSLEQFDEDGKLSNGGAILGHFEYKKEWDESAMVTSHTVKVPKAYVDEMDADCFFVVTHAVLSNGETAYGGLCDETDYGVSLDNAKQFPGANWSVYFEFCKDECTESIDFTYAWEDLRNSGNDADYNDLVIQSDVIRSADELKITFLATARGAGYDHEFKFKIPMLGITDIFGEAAVTDDGTYYYVTVFESTKGALPEEGVDPWPFSANTVVRDDCTPFAYIEIVLTTDGDFLFDALKPYEPFITVYPSGTAPEGDSYDLYIYEVSGRDTWLNWEDKEFPNGIIIPRDWQWPLEKVIITTPYPNFTHLAAWTTDWADFLADDTKVFDKTACE